MININDDAIPCEHISQHDEYQFPLSNYQKYAISAIEAGDHVIVSAPTGTGKTLIAEHAIRNALRFGKKAIYTSPLVALTNQKFSNLNEQYPDMNLGVLTGYDSENANGNVLLMTTEILLNKIRHDLFSTAERVNARFPMNIEEELGVVIFDEIHYFSDEQRGAVWEEIIMLLPPTVIMVMLSGTLSEPERFAHWILQNQDRNRKNINIVSTAKRIVPLEHYSYFCVTKSQLKNLKGSRKEAFKAIGCEIGDENLDQLLPLHGSATNPASPEFNISTYSKINKLQDIFEHVSIRYALNSIIQRAKNMEMLPAICFVLSRSKVEEYANMVEQCLFPDDSSLIRTIENHAIDIIRSKLVNYREILLLDQFQNLMSLFKKGIGIHHAGMLPVLRELVEILVEEGQIQLLFCTETFAAGLNMPIRCVIMISLEKFSGRTFRYLHSDEYSQMSGRGGRRGKDSVGYVIHMNNNFDLPPMHEYKLLMSPSYNSLNSTYNINHDMTLMCFKNGVKVNKLIEYAAKSFQSFCNTGIIDSTLQDLQIITGEKDRLIEGYEDWIREYEETVRLSKTKGNVAKRARIKLANVTFCIEGKTREQSIELYNKYVQLVNSMTSSQQLIDNHTNMFRNQATNNIDLLVEAGFLSMSEDDYSLTELGNIASGFFEVPNLLYAIVLKEFNFFNDLSTEEIICCMSLYQGTKEDRHHTSKYHVSSMDGNYDNLLAVINKIEESEIKLVNLFGRYHLIPFQNQCNTSMLPYLWKWINVKNETEAMEVFREVVQKENCIGDFAKLVVKVNNACLELSNIAERFHRISLVHKMSTVPTMLIKFVITSQSLHV